VTWRPRWSGIGSGGARQVPRAEVVEERPPRPPWSDLLPCAPRYTPWNVKVLLKDGGK